MHLVCKGTLIKQLGKVLLSSIHKMFSCRNKKNIHTLWLKNSVLSGAMKSHTVILKNNHEILYST